MAKTKISAPSVLNINKDIKRGKILPVYYIYGEDSFGIDSITEEISKAVSPLITSDFDKEVFYGEDKGLSEVLDFALAFPFGSEKKFLIFKEFEKVRDKKALISYAKSPADFTTILFIHNGVISNTSSEPYLTLLQNNFLFEAKELKGNSLTEWLIDFAASSGKNLSYENAAFLIDIVGGNRNQIEAQLEKIYTFVGDKNEIDLHAIKSLSTALKEYSIFDLQNAIGKKDKEKSLKISLNMIEKGAEPTFIIFMLIKYFTGLARINELVSQKIPDQTAARIVGTHPYYYKDYVNARKNFSDKELYLAVQALLKADLSVKTTSADKKTIIALLMSEILK